MGDGITVSNIPAGLDAVAGYVGGSWPTYWSVLSTFPAAKHLSIAVNASEKADCLDVEGGDASPGQIPGWFTSWTAGNTSLPVIYTSGSGIQNVISAAGRPRGSYLIWSAHYDWPQAPGTSHICGPGTCGYPQADGTQWTTHNQVWDESVLNDNFFDDPPVGGDVPLSPDDINAVTSSVQTMIRTLIAPPSGEGWGRMVSAATTSEAATQAALVAAITAQLTPVITAAVNAAVKNMPVPGLSGKGFTGTFD
jgi:hypothetical protein